MLYRGKTMEVTADQLVDVRHSIGENQIDFGMRLGRSRWSIIRWEKGGLTCGFESTLWHMWQNTVAESVHQAKKRGDNDQARKLQHLQILRGY